MLYTQESLKNTSRIWRRSCASTIRVPAPQVPEHIEDTRKVSSQYIRDKEGRVLRDPGLILERGARFFVAFLNAKYDKLRLDIIEGLSQKAVTYVLGSRTDRK